jgi:hypothetical protein
MPRIYSSMNDPLDFCRNCFPDEVTAEIKHGNMDNDPALNDPDNGNGFGYDCSHPCYEWEAFGSFARGETLADGFDNPRGEFSPDAFECERCGKVLRKVDNGDGAQ